MMKISMAILAALMLLSVAYASSTTNSTKPTILCFFHIYCATNSTATSNTITTNITPVSNVTTSVPTSNTSVEDFAHAILLYSNSSQGQWEYKVIVNRTNQTKGIMSFALLGSYGLENVFVPSLYTTCTAVLTINCTVSFSIIGGSYTEMEVENNGKWLYAIKLPGEVTPPAAPVVNVPPKAGLLSPAEIAIIIVAVIAASAIIAYGNYKYDKDHQADLYKL